MVRCSVERWIIAVAIVLAIVGTVAVVLVLQNPPIEAPVAVTSVWHYRCEADRCVKRPIEADTESPIGLLQCRQTCGADARAIGLDVWPKLTGAIESTTITYEPLNVDRFRLFAPDNVKLATENRQFWQLNQERLIKQIRAKRPLGTNTNPGASVDVRFVVADSSAELRMNANESYRLAIDPAQHHGSASSVQVLIESETIFGARHALETLSQLIIYDDINDRLLLRTNVRMSDAPAFVHRGVSLDTSRNYYSIETIRRTIDTMAMVKLNVFHWHITDSHSFPVVIESHPYLHRYGSYAPDKVYTAQSIRDIVRYAYVRGVHVVPEFDAPAHVGEGWQFTNLTTCFNIQPWAQYCYEAPCGQLDPTQDRLYDVLQDIYGELLDMFGQPEWFHMGGDEVKTECWATSDSLNAWMTERQMPLSRPGYMQLWNHFQRSALQRLDRVALRGPNATKIVLWTSTLTEDPWVDEFLDASRYVVQVWTRSDDEQIGRLLAKGFELIMTNYDVLYLDCGYESWTGLGNNWCSPYSGWHKIYNQDLKRMGGNRYKQIRGSEVVLWSEQADDQNLDGRIWPRAMALAERLWSDPKTTHVEAESRILRQRERLVQNGVRAERLQPEWCMQNEGNCMHL